MAALRHWATVNSLEVDFGPRPDVLRIREFGE
jgi:hypothetical protein